MQYARYCLLNLDPLDLLLLCPAPLFLYFLPASLPPALLATEHNHHHHYHHHHSRRNHNHNLQSAAAADVSTPACRPIVGKERQQAATTTTAGGGQETRGSYSRPWWGKAENLLTDALVDGQCLTKVD